MCSQAARCVLRRIISAGARFNPRSLRRVSSVDAGIDPRTQATITTTKEDITECLHPSRTVHAHLLGNSTVQKADDGLLYVTPDLAVVRVVEKTKSPNLYIVTLVAVTFCLEHKQLNISVYSFPLVSEPLLGEVAAQA